MSVLLLSAAAFAFAWVVLGLRWRTLRWALLVWWLAVLAIHYFAASSQPLYWIAYQLGGSLGSWFVAGIAVALVIGYRRVIGRLRDAALPIVEPAPAAASAEATAVPPSNAITDAELERYARHIVLREIGGPGQMRLRGANVLLIGAGGLGAPAALYLAAAGVGRITLADDDAVSLSNLQRQVIFRSDQTGESKANAGAAAMRALNPHVTVTPLRRRITADDAALIAEHDLVLDGTDTFAGRLAINAACVAAGVPLLAGAIAQWEGQLALYDPARGGPCLACLFPEAPAAGLAPACAEAGVVGALPGVVGSLMALEAIKHLTGAGQGLRGRMLIFDGLYGETRMIQTERRADCPVCGGVHPA
ncbi:molybdopterin-synthase adenylyltransferase MoeB [uncultured Paracoccus sp.]|uniref:HesA/MoeB/ThiF family protein n=1 Tax=uncultured Paracoccus sp. TaxID=189685 RepID=UPI002602ADB1|nr:molybdopterin-synthase adenylyltransferase MoeB [uncultured Paracoccus sp.]